MLRSLIRISSLLVALLVPSTVALMACGSGDGPADGGRTDSGRLDAHTGDGASGDAQADATLDVRPSMDVPGPGCSAPECGPGERCSMADGGAACIAVTCAERMCAATELCVPAATGSGFVCRSSACTDSIDCPASHFCNGTMCVADVCTAGTTTCNAAGAVVRCADDGSGSTVAFTCTGSANFTSRCTESPAGAYCPCEDDWDCPANTACEAGRCAGTGRAPTCRLPPAPFTSVLPGMEPGFPWGGTGPNARQATRSPFPDSSQVVMTPLVVNLDDDNGDGLVNELDFPEIVFLTFCGSDYQGNGILRAVHGGGANRGGDYFASCATTRWSEGQTLGVQCTCESADLDSTAGLAAGDIDGDGVPEIVAITEGNQVRVYSNRGAILAESTGTALTGNPSPSIANLDGAGTAEIIVGRVVYTLERRTGGGLAFVDRFEGTLGRGTNTQGPISCVANIAGGTELEIVAGSTAYRLPTPPVGVTRRSQCPAGSTNTFCIGQLAVVWDGRTVSGTSVSQEGFCAIADVLGANRTAAPGPSNPLDGNPEVVLVANGRVQILDAATGRLHRDLDMALGTLGGAPNIDDFDGDGFPEIGTAFATAYTMIDLQNPTAACPAWPNTLQDTGTGTQGNPARNAPTRACTTDADCGSTTQFACNETIGRCVCLHNGWKRGTEDDSSRVTGSTVFDFNGDGAAEIIYNDECYFRIYEGLNGNVLFREASESRTRTENPVVADVDNDGNAEIVFATSNESGFCSDRSLAPRFNNGIEVWGDRSDSWVPARRIWNQHSYHVTNVTESGGIPLREPASWRSAGGREYNTYRSQPRGAGIAPNLVVERVQISSPGATCGALSNVLEITARVANRGDVRVGPDVEVGFFGIWTTPALDQPLYADATMTPLRVRLGTTLEPGGSVLLTARYDVRFNTPMRAPDSVRVMADVGTVERECIETDNALTQAIVSTGNALADLSVTLGVVGGTCPTRTFETTVQNQGGTSASNVLVRYYLGNPSAGGTPFHEERIAGPIAPGDSVTITARARFPEVEAVVFVTVDPEDTVPECNDANNTANTPRTVLCAPG